MRELLHPQSGRKIEAALPNACAACPWRITNQGQPHPHGFYDRANIKRLWDGIRKGDAPGMTCHPTDPSMAEFEGYEETAERERTHECMGSWVMITREVARFQAICLKVQAETAAGAKLRGNEALRRYTAQTCRKGMTHDGLRYWAMRLAIVMPGQNRISPTIDTLNDQDIGTPFAPDWDPTIAEKAKR